MSERDAIVERYQRIREDPMTPQYLVGAGQSGSLLDYQESEELGELACREGHKTLYRGSASDYEFCSTCGHRVCPICNADVGRLIAAWTEHWETHQ